MEDEYGLLIDPDGDFTAEPDFWTIDPSEYAPLADTDDDYVENLDTEIDDADDPPIPFQKKYRIRLRWKRWKIKQYNVAEWRAILDQFKSEESQEAVATMQAYWLAQQLGVNIIPSP